MAAAIHSQEMLPIRMQSTVVRGFGRGSSDLGIPTANLDRQSCQVKSVPLQTTPTLANLPTGIYWGFARIADFPVYTAAISIGYNPTYGNQEKTVEPHLIAATDDPRRHSSSCGETVLQDFYDQPIRLTVVDYLRPELPFEGLEKLIVAIKNDISVAEQKSTASDKVALTEKRWVAGEDAP
jgi:FAD synthase